MDGYKWTLQDAQAIGSFMGEVEGTLKIIAGALVTLAFTGLGALGYWVFA